MLAIRGRRTKILFYLASIVLPSLLLVVFTLRLVSQDRELAQKRVAEDRQKFALDVGRSLLSVLDKARIRSGETGNSTSAQPSVSSTDPLLVLACELRGTDLILPWEDDPQSIPKKEKLIETPFLVSLGVIEKAEFGENNPAKAAELCRALLKSNLGPGQAALIRLTLARSLYRAGHADEARGMDRSLLSLSADVRDEYQIPFSLYAAERLTDSDSDLPAILSALDPAVFPWKRLTPGAFFHGRDIFSKLERSANSSVRNRASRALTAITGISKSQEQAVSLKNELPGLGISTGRVEKGKTGEKTWTLFGQIPWFVSAAEIPGRAFLVACDTRIALKEALEFIGEAGVKTAGTTIEGIRNPNGLAIGPAFPNARIVLPPALVFPHPDSSSSRTALYILMVVLALGLAIIGSVLFWRDVRRELKTAELRSQFVASVSHELKTPLAAIRMFADTLRLGRLSGPEKRDEYLETIANESQRLDRLIANVLDFSKIERGSRIYRSEGTSIREVLESAVRIMDYPLGQRGFRLKLDIAEDAPEINADRDALLQAVLNLIDNAMKYSGDARDIELSLGITGETAVIRIRDWGIGIPENELKRIFEKFHRVSDPRNEGVVGAGLGLSLAAHIIEAHGGRIDVQSQPGEGSVFSIVLPLENPG